MNSPGTPLLMRWQGMWQQGMSLYSIHLDTDSWSYRTQGIGIKQGRNKIYRIHDTNHKIHRHLGIYGRDKISRTMSDLFCFPDNRSNIDVL